MVEDDRRLTVVCFLWRGWRALYDVRHVNAVARMLERHMSIPYRLVCVTDETDGIECETIPGWEDPVVHDLPSHHNSYRRLKLFSSWAAEQFPGWILAIDIDCLIVQDLAPLITWDDFRILQNGVCHYNGSMWLHRTGTRTFLWDDFDPMRSPLEFSKKRAANGRQWKGSDQAWISYRCGDGERMYTPEDGVYKWYSYAKRRAARDGGMPSDARILFFSGPENYKPWSPDFAAQWPKIHKEYMGYLR